MSAAREVRASEAQVEAARLVLHDLAGLQFALPQVARAVADAVVAADPDADEVTRLRAEAERDRLQSAWDTHDTDCAAVEAERDRLAEVVARVEALHPRGETWYDPAEGEVTTDDDRIEDGCQACCVPWPCATITALSGPTPAHTPAADAPQGPGAALSREQGTSGQSVEGEALGGAEKDEGEGR